MHLLHGIGECRYLRQCRRDHTENKAPDQFPLLATNLPKFLIERLPVVQDKVCPLEDALAFGREADVALVTLDNRHAKLLLKLPNASRQGRLSDIAGLG